MNELMFNNENEETSIFQDDEEIYGKKITPRPAPKKNIGIDVEGNFFDNIAEAGISSKLDIAKIESFTQVSQNRDTTMKLIDTMSEDPTIAAALEIYSEDVTESNDKGQIVWCESPDAHIASFVTYLLDTMNVDKNIYSWVYSLCKYGDLYLRLYRNSETEDKLFNSNDKNDRTTLNENIDASSKDKSTLNEDVILQGFAKNDNYSHYVEMVPNPAEMFELTRYGKTSGFIKANVNTDTKINDMYNTYYKYSFKRQDVEVYDATNFVHACLQDSISRIPEEVDIFLDDYDKVKNPTSKMTYKVRKGQSLLYNTFKIWRELMFLENSMLLNRITKSSITRIIGVEVGDMAKEAVGPHLMKIKSLIEQKSALNTDTSLEEYTSPGPVENNVYVPTRNGIGSLSTQQIGGDVNVNGLADVDYFKNRFYSALKIPKQFLGDTDDATGFNGGSSLSIVSSRYAKTVKRIQNSMIQCLTDAVNLMLLDKGLDSYINKFQLKMQPPTTQEEVDRQTNASNRVNIITDVMSVIENAGIESNEAKLKILKSMITSVINDAEVISVIEEEIANLEETAEEEVSDEFEGENGTGMTNNVGMPTGGPPDMDMGPESEEPSEEPEGGEGSGEDMILPMPSELGAGDLTEIQ